LQEQPDGFDPAALFIHQLKKIKAYTYNPRFAAATAGQAGEAENLYKRVDIYLLIKFLFMKKLKILSTAFVAVVLIAAFSAFTFAHNDVKKDPPKYFFYQVVSGSVNTSSPLFSQAMTVADFQQVNPVSCPAGSNSDCIRAWAEGNTPTTTGAGDYTITKL
jgi:hypothetical protein